MKTRKRLRIAAGVLLMAVGAVLALYPYFTDIRYAFAQRAMAAGMTEAGAAGQPMPGEAVTRLVIPRITLDAFVLEGTTPEVLNEAPGHYPDTPLPGTGGNSAIAGHRTMYGHPFRRLDELQAGDEIVTYTPQRRTRYTVVSVTAVQPTDVGVAAPTADARLTLTTCNPVGSAAQRLVVVARQVE
jgi:sortase A